jgi:hypothetical protein
MAFDIMEEYKIVNIEIEKLLKTADELLRKIDILDLRLKLMNKCEHEFKLTTNIESDYVYSRIECIKCGEDHSPSNRCL